MSTNKINLKDISIRKMQDPSSSKDYFVIVKEDSPLDALRDGLYTPETYLCIQEIMETGWDKLIENYGAITDVEIEYKTDNQGNKVINLTAK